MRTYGKHLSLKSTLVFGGVGIQPQIDALRRGVDVLVATPGRLLDHVEQKTVDLRQVEILVLDEADRMLDMGFIHDIRRILALLPKTRQNLLFSATFPDEIRKLAGSFMKDPVTVEVARRNTPAELVAQVQHPVEPGPQARAARPPRQVERLAPGAGVLAHQARRQPPGEAAQRAPASRPTRSTATRRRTTAPAPSSASRTTSCASWWRPTSRRAASTSRPCRTSSTTTCRTSPKTTCTASAAPAAPAPKAKPSRWSATTSVR